MGQLSSTQFGHVSCSEGDLLGGSRSGEYYLDSLAVRPEFRGWGIGRTLLEDGIRKGFSLGYDRITLVADSDMPHLIRLYESIGFRKADIRHVFGVEFQRMVYKENER